MLTEPPFAKIEIKEEWAPKVFKERKGDVIDTVEDWLHNYVEQFIHMNVETSLNAQWCQRTYPTLYVWGSGFHKTSEGHATDKVRDCGTYNLSTRLQQ